MYISMLGPSLLGGVLVMVMFIIGVIFVWLAGLAFIAVARRLP